MERGVRKDGFEVRRWSAPVQLSAWPWCTNPGTGWTSATLFNMITYGDHLQTCETQSAALQANDWSVHKLGALFGSVGHKVKIHKITE